MLRAPGRSFSRRDTLSFLACLVLSLVALLLPSRVSYRVATGIRETALLPIVWLQLRAEEGRTSRARFQSLQAERDSASIAAQSLSALVSENERLRLLVGMGRRAKLPYVAADVMHQTSPTDDRTLLLSVGVRSGVRPYAPVVSPEGLVGTIVSVGPSTSIAMSWAHPEFRAHAVTADGSIQGVVRPSTSTSASETFLELHGVAYRDSVPNGTVVFTSGLGGVYPKGIPIGRIAGIRREQLGWERVYRLTPSANPGLVAHVLVYLVPRDSASARTLVVDSIP